MNNPNISVIIPTYNRIKQVTVALESVLVQSYSNFEVIIVDDGSTDGTQAHLNRVIADREGGGSQIRYFYQSNHGSSTARNRGIAEARGEWIAFLDSDDIWFRDKLQRQMHALETYGDICAACITDAKLVSDSAADTTSFQETGKSYVEQIGVVENAVERLARSFDHFWVTSLIVKTQAARQIGGFDPNIQFCEDHDFNFRLSLVTSFCYVNGVMVQLDRSPAPVAIRPWEKTEIRLRNRQVMLEKWLTNPALAQAARRIVLTELRQVYSAWGNWYLETERYAEAHDAMSRAVRIEPTVALRLKWLLARTLPKFARRLTPKSKAYTA